MAYNTLLVEIHGPAALIRLNRPDALNALNAEIARELAEALRNFDNDAAIGAIVITGSDKAFAAGADIKEMKDITFAEAMERDFIAMWDAVSRSRKPKIAAVAGFALGGGCELAMICDFIIAAETAKFGQPEIKLGIVPGIGGSQRLARAAGKAKAMDLVLTGRMMDAAEAERCGIVSRIVPAETLIAEALAAATLIAGYGRSAVMLAKQAVDSAFETPLSEGLRFERQVFYSLFGTADQKEGMAAFIEKRKPVFGKN
jgi:enoyl-CoA hydratase